MAKTFAIAIRTTVVTLILTGLLYPVLLTGLSQVLFPQASNGSLVKDEHGRIIGSQLVGQNFSHPGYFWSRPSAAGENGYDATASGGSNLGPTSQKLRDRVTAEINRLRAGNPGAPALLPVELVTASASGLDPHLSPAAAEWQISRVAEARKVSAERLRTLVAQQTEGRSFGVFGEPRVNLLLLNLALDRRFGRPPP